jgi:hypothetical protein
VFSEQAYELLDLEGKTLLSRRGWNARHSLLKKQQILQRFFIISFVAESLKNTLIAVQQSFARQVNTNRKTRDQRPIFLLLY